MITTVTGKNMVSIPRAVSEQYRIKPGWKFDWSPGSREDELVVRLIPDRSELSRRLRGSGQHLRSGDDTVSDLVAERENEDLV